MWRSFKYDNSGHFAVFTAIVAVPILLCVAVALEFTLQTKNKRTLQAALDSAALAAVIPGNMSVSEREQYAEQIFFQNFARSNYTDFESTASNDRVDVTARYQPKSLFVNLLNDAGSGTNGYSSAVRTVEDVICVMTLNEIASDSLTIDKNALLQAPGCSVQVNSNAKRALYVPGTYVPSASSICVVGGAAGSLPQDIKTACSPVQDPYDHLSYAGTSVCDYSAVGFNPTGLPESFVVGEPSRELKPGVYCGGLHIYDSNVKLNPGTYVIKDGPLTVGHNAVVNGSGVTFVFTGKQSVLYTYDNVEMDLTAPSSGYYAGLIFFQDRNSSVGETSILKGGIDMRLVGTAYFPTQDLFVGGVGEMGAKSPAMAFIADNITFTSDIDTVITANEGYILAFKQFFEFGLTAMANTGYAVYSPSQLASNTSYANKFLTSIATNLDSHENGGIPPILPRSDSGARLVPFSDTPPPSDEDDD